jgi:xylan 1,4-beta-xylosidase
MNAWVPELIQYCRDRDVPLDFITTHHYPGDAAYGDDGAIIFAFRERTLPRGALK